MIKHYIADFETTGEKQYELEGETKVWLWYIENIDDDNDYAANIDIKSFLDFFEYKRGVTYKVGFHNLPFDWSFIVWELARQGYTSLDVTDKWRIKMEGLTKCFKVLEAQDTIYGCEVILENKARIKFYDTYLLLNMKVSELPYSTKGEIDHTLFRNYKHISEVPQTEYEYCVNDVKTVKRNIQEQIKAGIEGVTITSACSKFYKKLYDEVRKVRSIPQFDKAFPALPKEMLKNLRKAYNGGWTYLNEKYRNKDVKGIIKYWDINSSYPDKLRNYMLPWGEPVVFYNISSYDKLKNIYPLTIIQVNIAWAVIKEGYFPFISKTPSNSKVLQKQYDNELLGLEVWMTNIDYEIFCKYYKHESEIKTIYAFKQRNDLFIEYVDHWNNVKVKGRETNNEYMVDQGKRMNNHITGWFATNPIKLNYQTIIDEETKEVKKKEYISEQEEWLAHYLPVTAFITAYGRKQVIEVANKYNKYPHEFVYGDTDSAKILVQDPNFEPDFETHDTKLGAWKYEGTGDRFKFIATKQYIIHEIIDKKKKPVNHIIKAIGSMTKDTHKIIDFTNFNLGQEFHDGKKQARKVKGGKIIKDVKFTFKERKKKK